MLTERIATPDLEPTFKPITVQITIETQEEFDALQVARTMLTEDEITQGGYSYAERNVWVVLLEDVAHAADRT